jgi:DNA ligase 1
MIKLPTLYKIDSKGKLREWNICFKEDRFWTEGGLVGMKMNVAKPTTCHPKNVGRANETTAEEQAESEARAKWDKKLNDGYANSPEEAENKKFYVPMLAQKFEDRLSEIKYPVLTQPKLDGIRCIMQLEGGEVVARTRNGRVIESIPHIVKSLKGFFLLDSLAVLDGELYNHDLKDNFNKITSLVRKQKPVRTASDTDSSFLKKQNSFETAMEESANIIEYWVYDAPNIDGLSENFLFSMRSIHLENSLNNLTSNCVKFVPTFEADNSDSLDAFYETYVGDGFEGQMVRVDSAYENKRSKNLLKRKSFQDSEYLVLDIEEGVGNRVGTAKNLICKDEKTGKTFNSNIKGSFEYLSTILNNKDEYIGKMATIKYFELTPDGIPRFPYAMSFRDYE